MKTGRPITRGRILTDLLGLAAIIHPVATLLAPVSAWADLLTPFHEPAIGLDVLAAAASLRWGPRLRAVWFVVLALMGMEALARFSGPNPVVATPGPADRLRLLMLNLHWRNDHYEEVRALLHDESADVVGLLEFSSAWSIQLDDLRANYPYRLELPGYGQGLALWSRRPFVDGAGTIVQTAHSGPAAWADLDLSGKTVRVWLIHPPCPITIRGPDRESSPGLIEIGRRIAATRGPTIVLGDLNRTDGSPFFDDFQATIGLRDSRLGFGRQPSWPCWSPYRIPIDHAFLADDLAVVERRLGPHVGSDHFPLRLVVAPARTMSSAVNQVSE
jgi:endonuclease/exonuclease/phosphatase (EEP) superfamily protein YafD